MLNTNEKNGATALLRLMTEADVISLAKTVTNNQISVYSIDDAIRAITEYSNSGVELLKRRKIKRDLLFQYLFKENVVIDPRSGKIELAKRILEYWGTHNVDMLDLMEIGDDYSTNELQVAEQASPSIGSSDATQSGTLSNQQPNLLQDIPEHLRCHSDMPVMPVGSWISDLVNFEHNIRTTPEDRQMGPEFALWFYRMLNACNPAGQSSDTQFGTQHFFPNCELKVAIVNTDELQVFKGAEAVCAKFLDLMQNECLIFCANVNSDGIIGFSTPHGMKIFLVCGTLHKGSDIVGVFAQQFGLVSNPERNFNWNIKFTNLKLIAGAPNQTPTLEHPGTASAIHSMLQQPSCINTSF